MKKHHSIILAVIATLAFAPTIKAQDDIVTIDDFIKNKYGASASMSFPKDNGVIVSEEKSLGYSKNISSPFSDGTYWIKLETFATGNATVERKSLPADIVLVLDFSGSMHQPYGSGYHYDVVTQSGGYAYSNTYWTAEANTGQRFYKFNGNYYQVQRGQVETGETGQYGETIYWRYFYFEANGTTYYLDDMSVSTVMPQKYQANNSVIWNGPLYQYKNFTNTTENNTATADRWSRYRELKSAVADFIDVIYHNDLYEDEGFDKPRATKLGNRISIVTFSGSAGSIVNQTVNGGWIPVTNEDGSRDETLLKAITNTNPASNTPSDAGMTSANTQLGKIASDRESSRTVVLFTDGVPGAATTWSDGTCYPVAIRCIRQAYTAKHTYHATVFSVSIWNGDYTSGHGPKMKQYLEYTSSNFPDANPPTGQNSFSNTGDRKDTQYFKAPTDNLATVFTEIAKMSGGSSASLSAATSNVDVVSNSFILPDGTNSTNIAERVKIFTAPLTSIDADGNYEFGTETIAGKATDTYDTYDDDGNVTGTYKVDEVPNPDGTSPATLPIKVDLVGTNGIKVTNFDYTNNWCGPVEDQAGNITYHGHKIIILIPIQMNPDAVGGPNVETNAQGSGIFSKAGDATPYIDFKSPTVNLPVNIYIEKVGLEGVESARFLIERAVVPDSGKIEDIASDAWEYVTTVFVTNSTNAKHNPETNNPWVKVRGLPSNDDNDKGFIYRVTEENWSWSYSGETPPQFTDTNHLENPFTFENDKKDRIDVLIRHAESKVTNVFKPKSTGSTEGEVKIDDSKTNAD